VPKEIWINKPQPTPENKFSKLCFIADELLEQLPAPSPVGKPRVGGIDLNKPRMR
jgi:hypothetical protein